MRRELFNIPARVMRTNRAPTLRPPPQAGLQTAGVSVQPRTSRENRKQLDPDLLRELYVGPEWTAAEIATELDTSVHQVLRTLHEHGVPVPEAGRHANERESFPTKARGPPPGS